MYNAGDRKDVRRAEKEARLAERDRVDFLRAALGTMQGRAWFHDLLVSCHLFSDPFTGDALWEAFAKGERNLGLRIYSEILANCPDQFVTMMREANARSDHAVDASNASGDSAIGDDPDSTAGADDQ